MKLNSSSAMSGFYRRIAVLSLAASVAAGAWAVETENIPHLTNVSISNRTIWADGSELIFLNGVETTTRKAYFENYLELRASFSPELTAGLRHSTLQPSYWNERLTNVQSFDKKWLQYETPEYSFKIGDQYLVWGRGLVLSLAEDFEQGLDAGIDGFSVRLNKGPVSVEAVRGRSEQDPAQLTKPNDIQAVNAELNLTNFKLGGSYLHVMPQSYVEQKMPGGYLSYRHRFDKVGLFSIWFESAWQHVPTVTKDVKHGTFGSLAFSRKGLSAIFEYKDNRFLKSFGNTLPYHTPPVVQRELISKSLSSAPHKPNVEDEIGWQFETSWRYSPKLAFVFYTAQASLHHDSPIPSMQQKFSPFMENMLEMDWKVAAERNLRLQYARKEEVNWNSFAGVPASHEERNGVLAGWQSPILHWMTVDATLEHMFVKDTVKHVDYNDTYVTATFSRPGKGSIAITYDHTTSDLELGGPEWYSVEATLPIRDGIQAQIFAGEERGGIKCSNGRCRVVNPFEGVRVGIEATF